LDVKRLAAVLGVVIAAGLVSACQEEAAGPLDSPVFDVSNGGILDPVLLSVSNSKTCAELGYADGDKLDFLSDGTYSYKGISVTIVTVPTPLGPTFTWTSSAAIDAVIVKGSRQANLYMYDPPGNGVYGTTTGDVGLHSPTNPKNGKYYGVSHLVFCCDRGGGGN
jgi:hypothetical protein